MLRPCVAIVPQRGLCGEVFHNDVDHDAEHYTTQNRAHNIRERFAESQEPSPALVSSLAEPGVGVRSCIWGELEGLGKLRAGPLDERFGWGFYGVGKWWAVGLMVVIRSDVCGIGVVAPIVGFWVAEVGRRVVGEFVV